MSKLTSDEVRKVASLAKLNLTDTEVEKYTSQLSAVIGHFDTLAKVVTEGIDPTSQTTGLKNVTREDKVDPTRTLNVDDALSGAKQKHNNYFVVPAILEK